MEAIDKATNFYKYGILPELVGKWYTRTPPITVPSTQAASSGLSSQASHASALLPSPQASTSESPIASQGGNSQETLQN